MSGPHFAVLGPVRAWRDSHRTRRPLAWQTAELKTVPIAEGFTLRTAHRPGATGGRPAAVEDRPVAAAAGRLPARAGSGPAGRTPATRRGRALAALAFSRSRGPDAPMSRQAVVSVTRTAPARAGIATVGGHRLRHRAASRMLAGGGNLAEAGQLLRQFIAFLEERNAPRRRRPGPLSAAQTGQRRRSCIHPSRSLLWWARRARWPARCGPRAAGLGVLPGHSWRSGCRDGRHAGLMLWLTRNRLRGSWTRLSRVRRA